MYFDTNDFVNALYKKENRSVEISKLTNFDWRIFLSAAALLFSSFIGFDSIAQAGSEAKNPSKTLPKEAWNAKSLREIRKAMVRGDKLEVCNKCWFQEDTGKDSYRHRHNNEWTRRLGEQEILRRVKETEENDGYLSTPPDYLDLRLGNLCNLKCRMCNVFNSNQIEKEHFDLRSNNRYVDMWAKQWPLTSPDGDSIPMEWVEAPEFWEQLNRYIPDLKKVYFTGGEPTLLQSTYDFMQEMVDKGVQDKVDLMFNTNCTNAQPRFLKMLSKFKSVQIQASIDGTKLVNDYIRAPSHWETIKKNFMALGELPNVKLNTFVFARSIVTLAAPTVTDSTLLLCALAYV